MDRRSALVYSKNGSLQFLDDDFLSPIAFSAIIVLCLLLALFYNLLVVSAILTSKTLRRSPYHVVLAQLAIACLLDSLTNESIAFGFLFDFDPSVCGASAMAFHFLLLVHSGILVLLLLQRVLELQDHLLAVRTCLVATLTVWIIGIIVTALLDTSHSHFFLNRNACSVVKSVIWPSLVYCVVFLITWCGISTSTYFCIRSILSQRDDRQQLTVLSVLPTLTDADFPNPLRPLVHTDRNRLSFTILFLHVVLILPHSISVLVNLFSEPDFKSDPWVDPRVNGQVKSVATNSLEPLFVFSRYTYNAVIPIAILMTDIKTRAQGRLIFCCRWNEVSSLDASERIVSNPREINEDLQATFKYVLDQNTPVLFATSDGLHLRVPERNCLNNSSKPTMSRSDIKLKTSFCDIRSNSASRGDNSSVGTKTTQGVKDASDSEVRVAAVERNVRFASQVNEIILESGVWSSSSGQGSSLSETHTVNIPLVVKHEFNLPSGTREYVNNV